MMVGCHAGEIYAKQHVQSTSMMKLARSRNMSGGSTGSLGSLESDLPELLSISWNSDLISNFRANFNGPSIVPSSGVGQIPQRISPSSQSVHSDSSSNDANSSSNSTSSGQSQSSQQKNIVNPTRYKTEMCRPFAETGYCKYGEKCQFAHGTHQLRPMPRHPKYKTELCRTFHTTGICPYGPRCHFIHSEDENKLGEINQMKAQYAQQQAVQEMASQAARLQLAGSTTTTLDGQLRALISLGHPLATHMLVAANVMPPQAVQPATPTAVGVDQFSHWMSMPPPPLVRCDTLGSSGESPPSSATSSPVTTPQFLWSNDAPSLEYGSVNGPLSSTPNADDDSSLMSTMHFLPAANPESLRASTPNVPIPLEKPIERPRPAMELANLCVSLEGLSFNGIGGPVSATSSTTTNEPAIFPELFQDTPPSSPDCGSLSSSGGRSMRLPVFSKLAACE